MGKVECERWKLENTDCSSVEEEADIGDNGDEDTECGEEVDAGGVSEACEEEGEGEAGGGGEEPGQHPTLITCHAAALGQTAATAQTSCSSVTGVISDIVLFQITRQDVACVAQCEAGR